MLITRAQNVRLQMLRKQLAEMSSNFGDEDYRNILWQIAKVRSVRDLPPALYPALMRALAETLNVMTAGRPPDAPAGVDSAEDIAERRRRRPRLAAVDGEAIRYATPRTISAIFGKGSYLFGRLFPSCDVRRESPAWVKEEVRRLTSRSVDDLTEGEADSVLASFRSRIGHIVSPRRKAAP